MTRLIKLLVMFYLISATIYDRGGVGVAGAKNATTRKKSRSKNRRLSSSSESSWSGDERDQTADDYQYFYGDYYSIDDNISRVRVQRQKHTGSSNINSGIKQDFHLLSDMSEINRHHRSAGGIYPPVFNVALKATIMTNATCGEMGREEYCRMSDTNQQNHRSHRGQCGSCDANSPDIDKRHLIGYSLENNNRWWQSPTLLNGNNYEHVIIDLDLGQIYQVVFVMIKAAISPRPSAWVLEKSLDGENFVPWQYFGVSETDCQSRYGLPANNGKYSFQHDQEVICSTQFSKLVPLENGEIHISLVNGRPGANTSSIDLLDFTLARYIRIRLEGMHTPMRLENHVRRMIGSQSSFEKQSFYAIRLIKIGGRCYCSGHAEKCKHLSAEKSQFPECKCQHNTCGRHCEKCCPLFNQRPYRLGISNDHHICERCQCHGHSVECRYNAEVAERSLSLNIHGEYSGGGVCLNCTKFTTGLNCEKCLPNYYRPYNVAPDAETPCIPCSCDPIGSEGHCNIFGGDCVCKEGFEGSQCSYCSPGYKGETCSKCVCDIQGTMPGGECESHCQCKLHVEGQFCDKCSSGYFSLQRDNPEGCMKCFCSGISATCKTSNIEFKIYETLENWKMTDIQMSSFAYPTRDNITENLVFGLYEFQDIESVYWMAPEIYVGNKLTCYGSRFVIKMSWIVVRGDTSGKPTSGPDVILQGRNGIKIGYGDQTYRTSNATLAIAFTEDGWYHIPSTVKDIVSRLHRTEYRGDLVTRVQFMSVLSDIKSVLLRATYHTDQAESILERASLYVGGNDVEDSSTNHVEECDCPEGYTGLSCELCAFGWTRIYTTDKITKCVPCNCNGHAATCDYDTGKCSECLHNTFGEQCERCAMGYYGTAIYGTEADCKKCACPLFQSSNNFSPRCQLKMQFSLDTNQSTGTAMNEYVCTQCPLGYTGDHCEICDDGYFGSPTNVDSQCLPCECHGGPCDSVTGQCITCKDNTEGWRCERCKEGFYGDPAIGCQPCACHLNGSLTDLCDPTSGHCVCKSKFTGRRCDNCAEGYSNIELDCVACECNTDGSVEGICDPNTGQCSCRLGISGKKCDACAEGYFGFSSTGCAG